MKFLFVNIFSSDKTSYTVFLNGSLEGRVSIVSSMEPEFYEAIKIYINAGGLAEDMEVVCSSQPAIHNLIKLVSEDCHRLHK